MRILSPSLHRLLDFLTIVIFALAPMVLNLSGLPRALSYTLAIVHLALTLLTRFAPAGSGMIPLPVHGVIELAVGIALVALPFVLAWVAPARPFFLAMGAIILVVWMVSNYAGSRGAAAP